LKLSSANILKEGKREIRAIGDTCDASCFTWYACAHSKPNGTCEGFVLMNGETRKHLNRILNGDDAIYVQECMKTIQCECDAETEETLVSEVLRYLPPQESERKEGFIGMVECALGVSNTPSPEGTEPEEKTQSTSEFQRMLGEARGRNKQPYTAIPKTTMRMTGMLRQIDESQFPEFCDPEKCPPDFARHCRANRPENFGQPCIYLTPRNR